MVRNCLSVLLTIIFLTMVSPALAQESTNYSRPGFYLGAGGLYAIEDFDTGSRVGVDNEFGYNFRLGYRITPNIAIEVMGERVDGFDLTNAVGQSVDTWVGTANGKFFFFTDRFQPYLLAGLGAMHAQAEIRQGFKVDSDVTGFAFRYGGGLDSYITEHWLVNLEISGVKPTGDTKNLDYFSLGGGIQYRF